MTIHDNLMGESDFVHHWRDVGDSGPLTGRVKALVYETAIEISYAVWVYYRFNLSHRDIEDLLAERGIIVTRESIRFWYPKHSLRSWGRLCIKFGAIYTRRLKRKHGGYSDTFHIDEVFAGVPDHSDQRQTALSVGGCGSGEPAPRSALGMAKSLMYTFWTSALVLLQSVSSSDC